MDLSLGLLTAEQVDPRLQAYIHRIWQPDLVGESPVSVTLGAPPEGHVVAEQYAVVPHARAARFLVPLGSRRTSSASFRTYNATRAPVSRALRGMLGRSYASGTADLLFANRLTVSVDSRFPRERWPEVLFIRHLAALLNAPSVQAFTAIRKINPNVKPTLELFDSAGLPVGFAKLGTTEATRHLVRTEAGAMAELSGQLKSVTVPELLHGGDWGSAAYAVSSPLPSGLRRWTAGAQATIDALLTISASGLVSRTPLASSSYAGRLRADIDGVGPSNDVARALGAWLDRLENRSTPLSFGRMHGDWIPDNLGRSGSDLVAWDWEHSHPDAPIGFDFLHWHFHGALVRHGMQAAVTALDAASPRLIDFGVPASAQRLVGSLYLLDACVRRMRLAVGGGGWSARWYPHLLEVAHTRDPQ